MPVTAPPIGAHTIRVAERDWPVEFVLTRLTAPFNAAGLPAVSVPVALAGGMPVGIQLAGAANADALVLHAARRVERSCPVLPRREVSTRE